MTYSFAERSTPKRRKGRLRFLAVGLIICALAGAGSMYYVHTQSLKSSAVRAELVRAASEVDTTGWKTYREPDHLFDFSYPETYDLHGSGDKVSVVTKLAQEDGIRTTITLETLRNVYLNDIQTPEMRMASWKVADRQTYALTTSYFTDEEAGTLSEIYLFVKNFPQQGVTSPTTVVRATVVMSPDQPDLVAAKRLRMTDIESVLTEPERILSTFRFIQRTELPGRDGRRT